MESSNAILPGYLVFSAADNTKRLGLLPTKDGMAMPRNARARERERHLLLYLQRLCAKNDTFGAFGPSAWGTTTNATGLSFSPVEDIAQREVFLERWTAHALASALNRDPEARPEFAPRLNPNGRLTTNAFVLADSGESIPLTDEAVAVAHSCDGTVPAHSLGTRLDFLENLATQRVIVWGAEVPAMEPRAFDLLGLRY